MNQHEPMPSSRSNSATNAGIKKLKCIVLGGANAGKTSILRKYFNGNFDPARRPTVGSDFYTKTIEDPTEHDSGSETLRNDGSVPPTSTWTGTHTKAMLSMQVWDTPGRERFAANQTKPMYTAAFSENFFKNADAALLVYDITSSTSFTFTLKWYEDLMVRIRRLEASGERMTPFPVLIVANKIDILRDRDTHPSRQQVVVSQRDVMGMIDKTFRGKDSRYEYTACAPPATQESSSSLTSTPSKSRSEQHRNRHELSTYMGTGDQTSYLQAVLNNDVQIGSYLESLLSTEDLSHPDIDMVRLWCMRNGLKHIEVSALDGTGIEDLMNEMTHMALEAAQCPTIKNQTNSNHTKIVSVGNRRNDELDLHRRYGSEAQSCFMLPFRKCCRP